MIEARGLTKDYGSTRAVDDLTFTVRPGIVTGFLGPNGAGKSTTMRMILGLDAPSAGEVTVNGKRYRDFPAPLHEIGFTRKTNQTSRQEVCTTYVGRRRPLEQRKVAHPRHLLERSEEHTSELQSP